MQIDFPYIWQWAKRPCSEWNKPGQYKGQRCRVLVRGRRMNSALVEFEDGYQAVVSRNGLRLAEQPPPTKQLELF